MTLTEAHAGAMRQPQPDPAALVEHPERQVECNTCHTPPGGICLNPTTGLPVRRSHRPRRRLWLRRHQLSEREE